ncbi:MAG: hypothetical protein ACRENP_14100 [Longimicrobiales bacterium]
MEKMMKYNEQLAKARVLLALDGLTPPEKGAPVRYNGGKVDGEGRTVHRIEGSRRRANRTPESPPRPTRN